MTLKFKISNLPQRGRTCGCGSRACCSSQSGHLANHCFSNLNDKMNDFGVRSTKHQPKFNRKRIWTFEKFKKIILEPQSSGLMLPMNSKNPSLVSGRKMWWTTWIIISMQNYVLGVENANLLSIFRLGTKLLFVNFENFQNFISILIFSQTK